MLNDKFWKLRTEQDYTADNVIPAENWCDYYKSQYRKVLSYYHKLQMNLTFSNVNSMFHTKIRISVRI